MIDNIQVLAHSAVRIESGKTLYFDPYLIEGSFNDADVIFLTHDHYDHFSPEDFAKVTRENTPVVAPATIVAHLLDEGIERDRIIAVKPGDALQVEGIPVEVVPSYNTNKKFHPQANGWVGYVVTVDGIRLTDLHSFSLDYVKGSPLLFSCVADVGKAADKPRGILN